MFNMVRYSVHESDWSHLETPLDFSGKGRAAFDQRSEIPKSLSLGTEYFTVDTGGTVFFLGGILADSGTRFDWAEPLNLDELVLLSSAKPAVLALLGLGLLVAGLLVRRWAQCDRKSAP